MPSLSSSAVHAWGIGRGRGLQSEGTFAHASIHALSCAKGLSLQLRPPQYATDRPAFLQYPHPQQAHMQNEEHYCIKPLGAAPGHLCRRRRHRGWSNPAWCPNQHRAGCRATKMRALCLIYARLQQGCSPWFTSACMQRSGSALRLRAGGLHTVASTLWPSHCCDSSVVCHATPCRPATLQSAPRTDHSHPPHHPHRHRCQTYPASAERHSELYKAIGSSRCH